MRRYAPATTRWAAQLAAALGLCAICGGAPARAASTGSIEVTLQQADGSALAGAAVTLQRDDAAASAGGARNPTAPWVMDQLNRSFTPEVIVVPVGASVIFPNSDTISHQVYSFSAAKRFQLPLYRGKPYPPVRFDAPGIITLGCNIHDNMVGWILVTDAPWFGRSDAQGLWTQSALAPGNYTVTIWHPRLREPSEMHATHLHVDVNVVGKVRFRATRPMRPAPLAGKSREWDY